MVSPVRDAVAVSLAGFPEAIRTILSSTRVPSFGRGRRNENRPLLVFEGGFSESFLLPNNVGIDFKSVGFSPIWVRRGQKTGCAS
jgi:hypothetical protein